MTNNLPQADAIDVVEKLGAYAVELSGKTIVFTGAGGFLGQHFMNVFRHLNDSVLDTPCRVLAMDNFVTGVGGEAWEDMSGHIQRIKHNVIDPFEFDEDINYIFHAASIASPYFYRAFPLETLDVATQGTRHMLDLAQRCGARFVHFSSSEIYGDPDSVHVPTPESYRGNVSCRGPRACYDESKRLGETLGYVYFTKFGTSTVAVRPFNVYGPGMNENDYRVLPNFASRIKAGEPLMVYGSGKQTRTFCYITDAMAGFLLAAIRGVAGEVYNIGNPEPEISMLDLVTTVEQVAGARVSHEIIEYPDSYPADEPLRRCPDITKARRQLGFSPDVGLADGLKRFFDWTEVVYTGEQK